MIFITGYTNLDVKYYQLLDPVQGIGNDKYMPSYVMLHGEFRNMGELHFGHYDYVPYEDNLWVDKTALELPNPQIVDQLWVCAENCTLLVYNQLCDYYGKEKLRFYSIPWNADYSGLTLVKVEIA